MIGIPHLDFFAAVTDVLAHPYYTALFVLLMVAGVTLIHQFGKKYPAHAGKLNFGVLAAVIVCGVMWNYIETPEPEPLSQFSSQAQMLIDGADAYVASDVECGDGNAFVIVRTRDSIEHTRIVKILVPGMADVQASPITCDKGQYKLNGRTLTALELTRYAWEQVRVEADHALKESKSNGGGIPRYDLSAIQQKAFAGSPIFDFEEVVGHDGIQTVGHSEMVDNEQGTTDVRALVTFSDGRKESCLFPVGRKVGPGGEWIKLDAKNRDCQPMESGDESRNDLDLQARS